MINATRRALLAGAATMAALPARAEETPGITATEILFGQTMPYSGPASSYGTIGKASRRLFQDDQRPGRHQRPQAADALAGRWLPAAEDRRTDPPPDRGRQGRLPVQLLGTPTTNATRKYVNSKKVPQLFVASGATQFGDREHYPWSLGWQPTYQVEGRIYAKYILRTAPDAKLGVLYQGDDSGRDYFKGIKDGLGDRRRQDHRRHRHL